MANFNYSINAESAVKEYDNQGAYNTLQEMMKRKEQLTVKFYGGKDNIPCAWIESAHVAGFKYQLKSASYKGLLNYLFKGDVTDFDTNPKVADTLNENEDFQLGILKAMIDAGKKKMTEQSHFLSGLNTEKQFADRMEKSLRSNKVLQRVLENPATREAFVNSLSAMLDDLKKNEKSNPANE